jgi:hypothetical protein
MLPPLKFTEKNNDMIEKVPFPPFDSLPINQETQFLSLGSCFAENIGHRLARDKFQVLNNPFGIVYHPLPMATLLEKVVLNQPFEEVDLIYTDGLWKSWLCHGALASTDKAQLTQTLQTSLQQSRQYLKGPNTVLILTFGTSYYYELISKNKVVANCHKQPGSWFDKKCTTLNQKLDRWTQLLSYVLAIHPQLRILLTLSPVRHLRDGLVNNSRSKALLTTLCHELQNHFPVQCHYFPAYEIMLDCLRDYTYYAEDQIHPTENAIGAIYSHFIQQSADVTTLKFLAQLGSLQQMLAHRPLHPRSESYQKYLQNIESSLLILESNHPLKDWTKEKEMLLAKKSA